MLPYNSCWRIRTSRSHTARIQEIGSFSNQRLRRPEKFFWLVLSGLMQSRWGCAPNPSFWFVLAASPPKRTRKILWGGEASPRPTAEADFATALVGFVGEADKTNQKLYNQ
jgi:hypothetical protein